MLRLLFTLLFIVIFGALSWVVPDMFLTVMVLGTGVPHMILGVKYSKSGISNAFNVFWKKGLVLLLIPLSFILGIKFGGLGLVFYFGFHHSISETYSHKSLIKKPMFFNFVYGLLVYSSFLIACRDDFLTYRHLLSFCYIMFFISVVLLIILTRRHLFKLDSIKSLIISHPWILAAPILFIFTLYSSISWLVLILYHFTFWGMLPVFRENLFQGNISKLKVFWRDALKWNGIGIIGFGLFAWLSYWSKDFRFFQLMILLFYIGTYWHISISFIISGANPPIIKNLFGKGKSESIK